MPEIGVIYTDGVIAHFCSLRKMIQLQTRYSMLLERSVYFSVKVTFTAGTSSMGAFQDWFNSQDKCPTNRHTLYQTTNRRKTTLKRRRDGGRREKRGQWAALQRRGERSQFESWPSLEELATGLVSIYMGIAHIQST